MAKNTVLNEMFRVGGMEEDDVRKEYNTSSNNVMKVLKRLVYTELKDEIDNAQVEEEAQEERLPRRKKAVEQKESVTQ